MDCHKVKSHLCHPSKDSDGSCVWNRGAKVGVVHAGYFLYKIYLVSQGCCQVDIIIPTPGVKGSLENVVQCHTADKGRKWDCKDRPLRTLPPHRAGLGRGRLAQLNPPTAFKITRGTSLTDISQMATLFILLIFFTEISTTVLICPVE